MKTFLLRRSLGRSLRQAYWWLFTCPHAPYGWGLALAISTVYGAVFEPGLGAALGASAYVLLICAEPAPCN